MKFKDIIESVIDKVQIIIESCDGRHIDTHSNFGTEEGFMDENEFIKPKFALYGGSGNMDSVTYIDPEQEVIEQKDNYVVVKDTDDNTIKLEFFSITPLNLPV